MCALTPVFARAIVIATGLLGLVHTQTQQLQEGAQCRGSDDNPRVCTAIQDCPSAIKEVKRGEIPEVCGFNQLDPLVCCEIDTNQTSGKISNEMCKEYAKAVFFQLPDTDGGVINYDTCGVGRPKSTRLKRVINGEDSSSREFPHLALVGLSGIEHGKELSWQCGGSLISDQFVLTVAHCAKPYTGSVKAVRLGDFNIQSQTDEEQREAQPTEYEVAEVFIHPDYRPPSSYNNIALLKLNSTVRFTEFIRPVCLNTQFHISNLSTFLVAGWGRTETGKRSNTLVRAKLNIFSAEDCFNFYKQYFNSIRLQYGIQKSTMLCAGDLVDKKNACNGDSGMPLQIPLRNPYCMYSQVAIVSIGERCGSAGIPSVFIRVSHYVPWIESIVWPLL